MSLYHRRISQIVLVSMLVNPMSHATAFASEAGFATGESDPSRVVTSEVSEIETPVVEVPVEAPADLAATNPVDEPPTDTDGETQTPTVPDDTEDAAPALTVTQPAPEDVAEETPTEMPVEQPAADMPGENPPPPPPAGLVELRNSCVNVEALTARLPGATGSEAASRLGFLRTMSDHAIIEGFGEQIVTSQAAVEMLMDEVAGPTEKLGGQSGDPTFTSLAGEDLVGPARGERPDQLSLVTTFAPAGNGVEQRMEIRSGKEMYRLRATLDTDGTFCQATTRGRLGDSLVYVGTNDVIAYTQRQVGTRIQLKELILAAAPNVAGGSRYDWDYSLDGTNETLELTVLANGSVAIDAVRVVEGIDPKDLALQAKVRNAARAALKDRFVLRDVRRLTTLGAPVYVTASGERLAGRYEVRGTTLSVVFDAAASAYPLLIDPTMDYVQWTGGESDDSIVALASDGGEIYATGMSTNPASWEPMTFGGTFSGSSQGFVVEISDGASPTITWGQWIGGNSDDVPTSIAVSGDSIYVGGITNDVTGWDTAPFGTASVCIQGFAAKVTDGISPTLDWVQLVGGDMCSAVRAVAVSGSSVYLGGESDSNVGWGGITFSGSHDGSNDGFVVKYTDLGAPTPEWGQWLGGTGDESVAALAVNGSRVFAGGYSTDAAGWELIAFQGTHTGTSDGFVVAVKDEGSSPLTPWGQWLGGDGDENVYALATNGSELYVGGTSTDDVNWDVAPFAGSFNAGNNEGFILELQDGATPTFTWGQWLGGHGSDEVRAIVVEGDRIYAGGASGMQEGWEPLATYGAFSTVEGFVVEVDDGAAPSLVWHQWVGGGDTDEILGLAVRGPFIFSGGNTSNPFDWEPFIFYGEYSGGQEGFVARITTTPAVATQPAPFAALRMTLEGPDSFGPAVIATGTKNLGEVFPVSVIINTGSAQVSGFEIKPTFDTDLFHLVDPVTGADITSIPNVPQVVGSVQVLFQGAASFPAAGPSNSVDNASPTGTAVLAYASDATDADVQIYVPGDTGGTFPGPDRLVTLYFKAMQDVTGGVITFTDDTVLLDSEKLLQSGEWQGVGTPSQTSVYIDADDSASVSNGDVRLTAVGAYDAASMVFAGDSDDGDALTPNILWDAMFMDLDASGTWDPFEPVYENYNYPNDWVDPYEARIYHPNLPTGYVLPGNADEGWGQMVHLPLVRQTGASTGSGTDLVGKLGVNLSGVEVSTNDVIGWSVVANRVCMQTGVNTTLVSVTVDPPLPGVPVTLTSSGPAATVTPQAPIQNATMAQTNASGVATFLISAALGADLGTVTFTAWSGATSVGTADVTLQAASCVSAAQSTIDVTPACIVSNGVATGTVVVHVRDDSDGPVSGVNVSLDQWTGRSDIAPLSVVSDAAGDATFTIDSTFSETVTYTATANGITVTQTADALFASACAAVDPGRSTFTLTPACVLSDGVDVAEATIVVRDASGNPIPGASVVIVPSSGPPSSPGVTDSTGTIIFWGTDLVEELVTLNADITTAAGTVRLNDAPQVQFAAFCGTVSNLQSTVTTAPGCTLNDGAMTSTVTVTVRDTGGALVPNVPVTLAQGTGASVITPASATTNASGVATFTVTNTTAQSVTYTATAYGTVVTRTADVRFAASCTAPSAGTSTVTSASSCTLNDGAATTTVTVTVRDASSAVVPNATVSLSQGTGASVITPASATTNASGIVTFTVTNTTAETVTYTATAVTGAGSVPLTQTADVRFAASCTAPSAVLSAANSRIFGPGTALCYAVGTGTPTITVTLRDTNDQPVTGSTDVTLIASPSAGVSIFPSATATGVTSGTASFTVSSSIAQTVTFTATALNGATTITVSTPTTTGANSVAYQASCGGTTTGTGSLTASKTALDGDKLYRPGGTVEFSISVQTTGGPLTDVRVQDVRDDGFSSFDTGSVTVSPASATVSVTSSQLDVTNLAVSSSSPAYISYEQKLKSGSDLIDDLGIDADADPRTDDDWWADSVVSSRSEGSDNNDEDAAVGAPDGEAFALGGSDDDSSLGDEFSLSSLSSDTSYVVVDFGDRMIVDGSGDDVYVLTSTASDNTDRTRQRYAVYASQDGSWFQRLASGASGSRGFDLGRTDDFTWARELLIVDETSSDDVRGEYPGTEIDGVGLLRIGAAVRNTANVSSVQAGVSVSPSDEVVVDLTSAMSETFRPEDLTSVAGVVTPTFDRIRSTAVGDPCYSTGTSSDKGGVVTFTLRDTSGNVVPGQRMTIVPSTTNGVEITPSVVVTDATGTVRARLTSTVEQSVTYSFVATLADTGQTQTVYTFVGVFRPSCSLPKTGSGGVMTILFALSAIPAAFITRRKSRGIVG